MRIRRVTIEQFALIAHADLHLADGLTVFSGETGSGKTMLLGALAFALGSRGSVDMIRAGAPRARVTLEIEPDEVLHAFFAAQGFALADEDEVASVVREMSAAGKSSARVNGCPAATAQVRLLAEHVADFVGQHEQQRLLSSSYQCDLLDRFAGSSARALRERIEIVHGRARVLRAELAEAEEHGARALAEQEFACFALREIEDAALCPEEETRLRERRAYLANAERIAAALACAQAALVGAEPGVLDALGSAAAALSGVARFGESMRAFHDAVVVLQSDAAELAAGLSRAAEEVEYEPEELEMLGARLDLIENLKRKYGGSLHAVLHERARFAEIVERFSSRDERLAVSRAALRDTDEELTGLCARLTRARTEAARGLEQDVAEELHGLSMPAARLVIDLEPLPRSTARGAESVTFMLAPNPGAGLKRLADIASGGELSRVLLALFAVLADRREQTMLLFDEIDAGIGGVTAGLVGARLRALAESSQVLCVTHAAQIAAWADAHYVLRKQADGRGACIEIQALKTPESARDEIARMLSGTLTQVARDHAQTLLIGTARSQ